MKNRITSVSYLVRRSQIVLAIGLQALYFTPSFAGPSEKSPPMKSASQITTAAAWADFADQIKAMGDVVQQGDVPSNDIDIAEGYRYLLGLLAEHIEVALYRSDLNDPLLRENISKFRNTAMPSSDGYYTSAQVDDQGAYRLWGKLGTAKGNISFQFYSSVMAQTSGDLRTFADANGHFDIQLGGSQKKENWMALPDGAQMIYIREYFSDWDNEHRSEYFFDRLDRNPVQNPLTSEQLTQLLQSVTATYTKQIPYWKARMVGIRQQLKNQLAPPKLLGDVGISANLYGTGWFDLKDNEAFVISLEQSEAPYWSFQLGNYWGQALDYVSYMPSITGDQAYLASDGKYWIVISNQDPSVPNWLDAQQHPEGIIFSRFQGVDAGPDYEVHVVKLSELQALLPADTPTISIKDRQLELRRRQDHMVKRWAP